MSGYRTRGNLLVFSRRTPRQFYGRAPRAPLHPASLPWNLEQSASDPVAFLRQVCDRRGGETSYFDNGTFVPEFENFRVTHDFVTSSSSTAAAILAGYEVNNGPRAWKTADGQSLREVEEAELVLDTEVDD